MLGSAFPPGTPSASESTPTAVTVETACAAFKAGNGPPSARESLDIGFALEDVELGGYFIDLGRATQRVNSGVGNVLDAYEDQIEAAEQIDRVC